MYVLTIASYACQGHHGWGTLAAWNNNSRIFFESFISERIWNVTLILLGKPKNSSIDRRIYVYKYKSIKAAWIILMIYSHSGGCSGGGSSSDSCTTGAGFVPGSGQTVVSWSTHLQHVNFEQKQYRIISLLFSCCNSSIVIGGHNISTVLISFCFPNYSIIAETQVSKKNPLAN